MTYSDSLKLIDSLKPGGMKLGLDRIGHILDLCGHPERRLRYIHVSGTNGKGSVSRMIQSILTSAGYRTGLYTSPSITGIRDTITIDGTPITEPEFADIAEKLCSLNIKAQAYPSEFEFTTAMAFIHFANRHTDVCVVECGLGGRDDATNVIPPPLAAVITPISLDHTTILGDTVSEITSNKCGIIKSPCSVITSPGQHEDALAVILETAAKNGLTIRIPSKGTVQYLNQSLDKSVFEYDGMAIKLPLTGLFQTENALTAIESVRAIKHAGFPVTKEQIQDGLNKVIIPCRQEVLRTNPLIMIDGAHNPQGVSALADTLTSYGISGLTMIAGMLADKDVMQCMSVLAHFCKRIICCTPDNPRALPAEALANILHAIAPNLEVEAVDSPVTALALAQSDTGADILIAGSFFLANVLRSVVLNHNQNL